MAFENLFDPTEEEHWSQDGAICPYCGYINDANNSDGYLYQQSTETYTCEHCNKKFEVQVDWTFDWTTKKIED